MKCDYKPELVHGPIGMFHCPTCGEMVVAGMQHPDYSIEVPVDFDREEADAEY